MKASRIFNTQTLRLNFERREKVMFRGALRNAATFVGAMLICVSNLYGRCQDISSLSNILIKHSLYIGELHGTTEVPELVQCVVEEEIRRKTNPLFVSLELPSEARNLTSPYWRGMDGRASNAMWTLLKFLLENEKAGRLTLAFQANATSGNQSSYDEGIGLALKKLSQQGRVISYGGNFHSRKTPVEEMPNLKPAGVYTGPNFVHVAIGAMKQGNAWFCAGADCGVHTVSAWPNPGPPGALASGNNVGHDYIFFVDHFTASLPHTKP